nr:LytTR family DNA-binding domain-containing protein [uncultured Duganella sp.]
MTSALIVEDEPLLRAELVDQLAMLWPELEIAGQAESGVEAVAMLEALRPDVVFLDIQIPGLNGLEVAPHVPESTRIVFVTAYAEHALKAFDAGAADYLVKPLSAERLLRTVKRLKAREGGAVASQLWRQLFDKAPPVYLKWIKASVGSSVRLVMVKDVQFFTSDGKYTRVATATGDALIRVPLKSLIEQLDPGQFAQVHRGAIVNLEAIERIDRDGMAMEIRLKARPETLSVSEAFTRQFRQM